MRKRYLAILTLGIFVGGFVCGIVFHHFLTPSPAMAKSGSGPVSLNWEEMPGDLKRITHRTMVPGGWLVTQQGGLTFIPDPSYTWK